MEQQNNFERILDVIKFNVNTSRFNEALRGSSIWLMIGLMDLPMYASVLKMSKLIANTITGLIQKKYSSEDLSILCEKCFIYEVISTALMKSGCIMIGFHFYVGVALIMIGGMFNGIYEGYNSVYRDSVLEYLFPVVSDKLNFRGVLKFNGSIFNVIGLSFNLAIMVAGQVLTKNQIDLLRVVLIIHALTGILDVYFSYRERSLIKKTFCK